MKKIRFLQSPTGHFKLAYDAGMVANLPKDLANDLIEQGYAEEVKVKKQTTKTQAKKA